jgi:hypothetical protein
LLEALQESVAVKRAIAEEREACARKCLVVAQVQIMADDDDGANMARRCAEAIRARGSK